MNFKGMKHGSVIAWIASLAMLMSLTACDGSGENTGGESTGNGALEPVVLGPGAGRLKIVAASGTVAESESMAVVEMSFAAESELDSGEALLKNPTSPVVSAVIEILAVDIHGADGKWYRFGIEPYLLDPS